MEIFCKTVYCSRMVALIISKSYVQNISKIVLLRLSKHHALCYHRFEHKQGSSILEANVKQVGTGWYSCCMCCQYAQ